MCVVTVVCIAMCVSLSLCMFVCIVRIYHYVGVRFLKQSPSVSQLTTDHFNDRVRVSALGSILVVVLVVILLDPMSAIVSSRRQTRTGLGETPYHSTRVVGNDSP